MRATRILLVTALAALALLCWLAFVGRLAFARRRPQSNRAAAYATIGLSMAIAVAVVMFVPPLPQ